MAGLSEQPRSNAAFIAALQAKDGQAWEEFINGYGVRIYDYLQYNLPSTEIVDDVWGDTMNAVAQVIDKFDQKVGLSTLVYSIAYRKVADYWRRQKYTFELKEIGLIDKPIAERMSQLSEVAQHALVLRYYVGLSVAEIAEILGRSYKATESLLSRVRHQLHEVFLDDVPTAATEHTNPEIRAIFGVARPLLMLQKQLCQQQGLTLEAAIFERAQQQIEQLSTIPAHDFLAELQKVEDLLPSEDPVQLIRMWLERHPKSDSSRQH